MGWHPDPGLTMGTAGRLLKAAGFEVKTFDDYCDALKVLCASWQVRGKSRSRMPLPMTEASLSINLTRATSAQCLGK